MSSINSNPVYPPKQASAYTGSSESSLAKRRMQGLPPEFLKIGSRVFYRKLALDAYLESCRRQSTSEGGTE